MNRSHSHRQTLVVAVLREACGTACRKRPSGLLHQSASKTERPSLVAALGRNLHAVGNHANGLVLGVFELGGRLIAREGVVGIGQVDDGRLAIVVTPEEGRALIQSLADECGHGRDDRHARQARAERLHVRGQDFRAIGEVVRRVGAVVVNDDRVDGAVEEGPDWVVLESFTTVDEVKLWLCCDKGRVAVLVEGVGVDGIFLAGAHCMDLVDYSG